MSPTRPRARRSRAGRFSRLAEGFDRFGRRALLAVWWVVAGAVRLVARAGDRGSAWAARWLRRQGSLTRLALAVVAAGGIALAWYWHAASHRDHPMDEVEALARVIRSEVGSGPPQHRLHVAWVTRNLAFERHQSIVEMVCSPCGGQDGSRPESSSQDATDEDRALAREVLAAQCSLDPTGGATHFINPFLQDELAQAGVSGYAGRTYRIVARRWRTSYGWEPYYRLGPTLELWGAPRRGRAARHRPCSPALATTATTQAD